MKDLQRTASIMVTNFIICVMDIATNKLRTFITTFGIFLGIGAFLVNVAFIRAMNQDIISNMNLIGGLQVLTVKSKEPSTTKEKIDFQRSAGLSVFEAEELVKQSPYIKAFLPQKDINWQNIVAEGHHTYAHVKAVCPQVLNVYKYELAEGTFFSETDYEAKQYVCLIGKQIIERLFGKNARAIGREVRIDRYTFKIIGVIHTSSILQERAYEIVVPHSLYASKFINQYSPQSELAFLLNNSDDAFKAKSDLQKHLLQLHRGVEDFTIEVNVEKIKEMESASAGIKILLGVVAFISLLVGGISIMNIMFASIGNRIREIGIRKALGATGKDIFIQFMIEAMLVSAVGGTPGMLLGLAVTLIPEGIFPFNPQLATIDYSLAILLTVIVGILAGCIPSLKAGRMQPVEALRY